MNGQWSIIIGAASSVFGIVGIGAVARQAGWLSREADRSLLKLIICLLLPCLIFSVVGNNQALKEPGNLIAPPLIGFASIMLGFLVAIPVVRLGKTWLGLDTAPKRRTFAFCVAVYNYGYLAIPLVALLFADRNQTLGVLFVYNVGVEIAFWTLGVTVITGHFGRGWWRHAVNPPSVTIVVALAFNFLGATAHLPGFFTTAVDWLGQSAIPMSLVLIGATIADQLQDGGNGSDVREGAKVVAVACLLRLGLLPITFLLVVMFLPITLELKRVVAVEAAMPSAAFGILMARHYGGDSATALRVVVGTSLAGLLTIPLWIRVGLWMLGTGGG